ncbi:MAG: tetrahydromethanopterin S-methyltransferase subunit F [Methanosphaera stadtmanae]|nr:tetrahydromethanopterin S-methyltransferase subunit F [Methanosphaera stadtmanae]
MNKQLKNIKFLVDSIGYKTQLIGRNQRLFIAVDQTRWGILIGFLFVFIVIGIPIIYYKGGF